MPPSRSDLIDALLSRQRPDRVGDVPRAPTAGGYHPSPGDWRDEVLYFLLPDRFSDGREAARTLIDRSSLEAARPTLSGATTWRWDRWAESGTERWQGGRIEGITSKLDYLADLGVTTIWVGPVFKQRGHLDTYHGYGIQDFLDVDPRFGSRSDLVDLVAAAHQRGLRIILDIIFNHSGSNFEYEIGSQEISKAPYRDWPGFYPSIAWRGQNGSTIAAIGGSDDGVWPRELQSEDCYTRAGTGNLGGGSLDDPHAEHKRSDFEDLRDFNFDPVGPTALDAGSLNRLSDCYKYWIALTDCDGFRIDTLKHVSFEQGRNFCGAIKEFAARLGKQDFFLVGEVAGGDFNEDRYLDVLGLNLNAALDIGEMRLIITGVAKGLIDPVAYFDGFDPGKAVMGSHRNLGKHHVSIVDDHDHVFGEKVRFSSEASSDHQIAAATALQLFTLGIPCIYYGSEQAFAGPEPSERHWLPEWKGSDRYLREAMFGPEHPRKRGRDGLAAPPAGLDDAEPGFGPFGTTGRHCFDRGFGAYKRIAALNGARRQLPALRFGRQYLRPTSVFDQPFAFRGAGELLAWSRVLDDQEALCILNTHGTDARGADVVVDASLNPPNSALTVVMNSEQAAGATASHVVGSLLPVLRKPDGTAAVQIRNVGPSEALVLVNRM
jgi:glycosidase